MKISFETMDRFQGDVSLVLGDQLTAIVGPNGSGKSTLLEAVAELMTFFQRYRIEGPVSEIQKALSRSRSSRPLWTRATVDVELGASALKIGGSLPEEFIHTQEVARVTISVTPRPSDASRWVVESVTVGAAALRLETAGNVVVDSRRKKEAAAELARLKDARDERVRAAEASERSMRSVPPNTGAWRAAEQKWKEAVQERDRSEEVEAPLRAQLEKEIIQGTNAAIPLLGGGEVLKTDLEDLITSLGLPTVVYLQGLPDFANKIRAMAQKLGKLHTQPRSERAGSPYCAMRDRLHSLLRMDVAIHSERSPYVLLVDDRPVEEVSQGTWCALGFAAICEDADENGLVIWDEPETGLHPTWARKICDLMLRDPRRFLIGTHRTEFVPITDARVNVYKTMARPESVGEKATCRLQLAHGIVDGFGIAAALGLEPSRVLFTTNAVIWVEGPSDVIYWRFWLKHAARQKNVEILEGVDFSFMFTAGALLANETFAAGRAHIAADTVNLLQLVGASLLIVDTDFNPDDVHSPRIARTVLERLISMHADPRRGFIAKEFHAYFKPRVRELFAAIEALHREDGLVTVFTTWGRETENALSDNALRSILRSIYRVEDGQPAARVLDAVVLDPWHSYATGIEAALTPSIGVPDLEQLWTATSTGTIVSQMTVIRDKIRFAATYVALMEESGLGSLRREARGVVESTLEWIMKVRAAYLQ